MARCGISDLPDFFGPFQSLGMASVTSVEQLRLAQFPSQSQLENSGSSGRAEPARSVHCRANSAGVIHCSAE